ncbi:hypothetical protein AKJ57_04420 [candidate division MSBL1 archaeon SCGC-AAA259A05]|uniref:DUF763 domain-containing protein n=1 Tax=candidate division MSBL1 archaeon SCGC-AAA259A05 TaxID=1698259 RepID=A0A133U7H1_9EURY|nr:hypothetical protein AKJ57_04420 [candidate division MSBL1 archaeon SCGC-AAA259A05]
MKRSGTSSLPLHGGKAPPWLVGRMKKLAKPIIRIIVDDYGRDEFLRRLSDPYWFQSLGCVLGYDWHSSGLTTVTTGVLKEAISSMDAGISAAGGKGKISLKTPDEIENFSKKFGFSDDKTESMKYASKMSAKVDNTAIQAGAPLYHHAFFASEDGEWAVIQQGMDTENKVARRFHWISEGVDDFVEEPHEAILAQMKKDRVLDLTAKTSEECRKTSTDLIKDNPKEIKRDFQSLLPEKQKSLKEWMPELKRADRKIKILNLPERLNWNALERAHELQPENFEKLLNIRGIGPATTRGLALVSEIIHGDSASWDDPAKYSYAFGGKDGVPYPVNRVAMDKAHRTLKSAIEEAELGKEEKLNAIKRLESFSSGKSKDER